MILGGVPGLLLPRLTFVASGISPDFATPTITIPAGRQAGDLCIIANWANGSSLPTSVVPSGFTSLRSDNAVSGASNYRSIVSAKKLVGTETTVTGMNGNTGETWIVLVLRSSRAFSSWNATLSGEATGGDLATQNIAAAGQHAPLFAFAYFNLETADDAVTPSMQQIIQGRRSQERLHYSLYNNSPINYSAGAPDTGNLNVLQSGFLTLNWS